MKKLLTIILLVALAVPLSSAEAALLYANGSTDKLACGSPTVLDNADPLTVWAWVYIPTANLGAARIIASKGSNANDGWRMLRTGANKLQFLVQGSTDWNYLSTPTFSGNTWYFVAFVWNTADAQDGRLYRGTLTSTVDEVAYDTTTTGNTKVSDAGDPFEWGNQSGIGSFSFGGRIATGGAINRALTLGELRTLQFQPRVVPGTKIFTQFGYNGLGTQGDYSGNGNACTVTGTSVAPHSPIRAW